MVPIIKQPCPENKYGIKCPFQRTPQFVVVHNTGNTAPADNEVAYMFRNNDEVSFHVAVDDKKIIEALPFGRNAWASGDGQGRGNMYGIHIEICYSNYNDENAGMYKPKFLQAEKNAAEYIARLLKNYGWGINEVKKHQDFDRKYCPHRTLDLGWQRFLDMVKKYITIKEEPELTESQIRAIAREEFAKLEKERAESNVSKWAVPAMEFCKEHGLMVGDGNGNLRPQSYVKREELSKVLFNLYTKNDVTAK